MSDRWQSRVRRQLSDDEEDTSQELESIHGHNMSSDGRDVIFQVKWKNRHSVLSTSGRELMKHHTESVFRYLLRVQPNQNKSHISVKSHTTENGETQFKLAMAVYNPRHLMWDVNAVQGYVGFNFLYYHLPNYVLYKFLDSYFLNVKFGWDENNVCLCIVSLFRENSDSDSDSENNPDIIISKSSWLTYLDKRTVLTEISSTHYVYRTDRYTTGRHYMKVPLPVIQNLMRTDSTYNKRMRNFEILSISEDDEIGYSAFVCKSGNKYEFEFILCSKIACEFLEDKVIEFTHRQKIFETRGTHMDYEITGEKMDYVITDIFAIYQESYAVVIIRNNHASEFGLRIDITLFPAYRIFGYLTSNESIFVIRNIDRTEDGITKYILQNTFTGDKMKIHEDLVYPTVKFVKESHIDVFGFETDLDVLQERIYNVRQDAIRTINIITSKQNKDIEWSSTPQESEIINTAIYHTGVPFRDFFTKYKHSIGYLLERTLVPTHILEHDDTVSRTSSASSLEITGLDTQEARDAQARQNAVNLESDDEPLASPWHLESDLFGRDSSTSSLEITGDSTQEARDAHARQDAVNLESDDD